MRTTPLLTILFLTLGQLLLPVFATPVGPDAPMFQLRQWGGKDAVPTPAFLQTLSPVGNVNPDATPSATVDTPTSTPTPSPTDTTPGSDSKAGSNLNSTNAGVALASRESLLFTVLAGAIATFLMF
ncbi:hypothetical protein EI94DRAFT_744042 [Lactarius quietus]|nr:hypothetical protein EI94DRAFT_744042 [Lactarius quietus]